VNSGVKKSNSRSELYRPSYINGEEGVFDVKPYLDKGVFKVSIRLHS